MMLNSDYLKPQWQKKRLEIMERDNFECVVCGDKKSTLHVHHSHYIKGKKVWEYSNCTFMTLCESCHKAEHEEIKQIDKYRIKRLSFLLQKMHDKSCETVKTRKIIDRYEYYRELFIKYVSYGEDDYLFYDFDEDEQKGDVEISNFKILEALMYYQINKRNVRQYINGSIMIDGYMMNPKIIGKDLLNVSRDLNRSVF